MAKYDPLKTHLLKQDATELVLSFADIEAVIDSTLPESAERPQFWANMANDVGHVQREAWRSAGYNAFLMAGERRVRFVRHAR
ncbi:MAG TPA: hypothetical protein VGN60_01405 [Devosia sp.]|jgi:hypothetical protein|nr:hypothetical protein [Devosia sp.]